MRNRTVYRPTYGGGKLFPQSRGKRVVTPELPVEMVSGKWTLNSATRWGGLLMACAMEAQPNGAPDTITAHYAARNLWIKVLFLDNLGRLASQPWLPMQFGLAAYSGELYVHHRSLMLSSSIRGKPSDSIMFVDARGLAGATRWRPARVIHGGEVADVRGLAKFSGRPTAEQISENPAVSVAYRFGRMERLMTKLMVDHPERCTPQVYVDGSLNSVASGVILS